LEWIWKKVNKRNQLIFLLLHGASDERQRSSGICKYRNLNSNACCVREGLQEHQSNIHCRTDVFRRFAHVTQYDRSICLFCNGAIVCHRITAILCRDTYCRTSWIINIIQGYSLVNSSLIHDCENTLARAY
jgi:hypothetical protein